MGLFCEHRHRGGGWRRPTVAFPEAVARTRGLAASRAPLSHAGSPLCLTVWGQRGRVGVVRRKKGRREQIRKTRYNKKIDGREEISN